MTYTEAIKFLYGLRLFGAKLGLENTFRLAELAGQPQRHLRFIHVAGTNGKGSTCAMLESVYRASGRRVGLFTSPHLVSFRERMQVNRQWISAAEVVALLEKIRPWLATFPAEQHPTFFEVVTVMALLHFAQQRCELVIWETGLGGRLDATNIVTPLLSAITPIGLDHQAWLGDTLTKIAAEKAGIIKPGVPVEAAAQPEEALAVLRVTAATLHAPFRALATTTPVALPGPLALQGAHQRQNAALVLRVVEALQSLLPVTPEALVKGLATVRWAGRLQSLSLATGQKVLLDGAHNPSGLAALAPALPPEEIHSPRVFIVGIMRDKDWQTMCRQLLQIARRIIFIPVGSDRTIDPQTLLAWCCEQPTAVECRTANSLDAALRMTSPAEELVITGSLYLIGEALALLDPEFQKVAAEHALNEWGGQFARPPEPASLGH